MDEDIELKNEKHPSSFSIEIDMPKVPHAFMKHGKIKLMLCHIAAEFGFEEQQALYFYCFLDAPLGEISEKVGLSQTHIASVLSLYSERLTTQLNFLKKAVPYDADDLLPVSEILV